jgi:hypothetical protein
MDTDLLISPRPSVLDEHAAKAATEPKRSVTQKLVNLTFDRRSLLLVIVVLVVGLVVQPMLFVNRLVEPEKVFAIDAAGNIVMGPSVKMEKSSRLHTLAAAQATEGLLNRNPAGFTDEDYLTTLFADKPLAAARSEYKRDEEDFKKRDLYQSVIIGVTRVSVQGDDYYLRTQGQLIRTGVDNLQPFRETPAFQVVFHAKKNPRITSNNRFPLVVVDYRYEEPSK